MTYFITALTADRARLIVIETRTTDKALADIIIAAIKARGLAYTVTEQD